MFKVNNKDTRTTQQYFTSCSSVSIVNFEHVNTKYVFHSNKTGGKMTS